MGLSHSLVAISAAYVAGLSPDEGAFGSNPGCMRGTFTPTYRVKVPLMHPGEVWGASLMHGERDPA
jgi:hypothetical protein